MAYVVPIHHASSVRHAIKSRFLTPDEECLVVAKANRLEFYSQTLEGLLLQHSAAIYGKTTFLTSIPRADPSKTDILCVGTDRFTYFTVTWDPGNQRLLTEQKYVDLADNSLREAQSGDRCLIDPTGRFITLEIYEGVVTVIPITSEDSPRSRKPGPAPAANQPEPSHPRPLGEPLHARIEELAVRSSAFFDRDKDDRRRPQMAILYEDPRGEVKMKLRELVYTPSTVSGDGGAIVELKDVDELSYPLDLGTSMLIPVPMPLGGLLVVGERSIKYVDEKRNETIQLPPGEPTIFVAWEKIDGQRWLLADDYGRLFFLMLILDEADETVESSKIDFLGETSRASVIVYLGAGLTFIGSHQGDSQLIRITEGSFEIVQTLSNIAPILDFTVMDLGNRSRDNPTHEFSSGQARIVTGSGAFNDGSLRSVRSGVGMEELGILGAMGHITDLWGLRVSCPEAFFDTLLVSFVTETRVFHFSGDGEVEEKHEFLGLSLTDSTILTSNIRGQRILQVCEGTARVADLDSGMVMWEWEPPARQAITAAASNENYLILVVGGESLVLFDLVNNDITHSKTKEGEADKQISGLTVTSLPAQACIACLPRSAEIVVLDVPNLTVRHRTTLGTPGEAVPRSVLVANVIPDKPATLFVAMADGSVFSFAFDANDYSLTLLSKLVLGSEPPSFKMLPRKDGRYNVFATCEHPSLIYSSEDRIVYSAVNTEGASRICHFNSEAYPGAIAVATPEDLKIAVVDPERTTQTQTLPMHETVRRVAYSASEKAFGIGTIQRTIENGVENIRSRFVLADEIMFRTLSPFDLQPDELVESVIETEIPVDGQSRNVFIVGTAYLDHFSDESIHGRILVFEVTDSRKLSLVTEQRVKGACRALAMMDNKIVAALVKTVVLFDVKGDGVSGFSLENAASYRTSTAPIDISVTGNIVVVADLMKSISLVEYTPGKNGLADSLTEIARHFQTLWSTAVSDVAENCFLVSDAEGNLVVLNRNVNGVTDDDKRRMEVTSEIRLGEMVNRIRPVNIQSSGASAVTPRAFMATVDGSIYLFGLINPNYQDLLMRLQTAIGNMVLPPGEMPFNRYRGLKTSVRQADEPFRFVDGELVERFLNVPQDVQAAIIDRVADKSVTVDFVKGMIEELRRMH